MIDPHVHCRDGEKQRHKETKAHALAVAERARISGIFDEPNTEPPITTIALAEERLADADKAKSRVFYGLHIGLTSEPAQIREAVAAWRQFFPKPGSSVGVVGLKMFAGRSVGSLGVIEEEEQRLVYQILAEEGFDGVLAVHCEKEALLKPGLWEPSNPVSHSFARPPEAETESVFDQIRFAENCGFRGNLHIAHVSVPKSVGLIDNARRQGGVRVSCGVTPHHCTLSYDLIPISEEGLLYKVNPPLRDRNSALGMLDLLRKGMIDWIETDHAPHTLDEKMGRALDAEGKPQYLSGFPGLPYYPHFIKHLRRKRFSREQLMKLIHTKIELTYGITIPLLTGDSEPDLNLHKEYEVDVYRRIRK